MPLLKSFPQCHIRIFEELWQWTFNWQWSSAAPWRLDELDVSVVCWGWWCGVRWKGKGGVDIGECSLTFNGLMAQQLNHLGEYGGHLVPRGNQDFNPYVPPLRSLIHRCIACLRWENNTRLLGSPRLFAFLYKLFFYLIFFCFQMIS